MKILNANFQSSCNKMISIVEKHYGIDASEEFLKKLETEIIFIFTARSAIIKELQNFMLEDLKKQSD